MTLAADALSTFSDRLLDFRDAVECRRLVSRADKEAAFRLRYEAYVREGHIAIDPAKRFTDDYDTAENVWIFGVFFEGRLASSIRVHVITPDYPVSPSLEVFPDVLEPEVDKGRVIVDPTRFVTDKDIARDHPELPYVTVRMGFLASERFRADLGLAAVRTEHRGFYRRLFRLQPLCEPRKFPGLAPSFSLLGINYLSVRDAIIARYPFMESTAQERWELFDAGEMADERAEGRGAPRPLPQRAAPVQTEARIAELFAGGGL